MKFFLILCCLFLSFGAIAESQSCSEITDDTKRLECFDAHQKENTEDKRKNSAQGRAIFESRTDYDSLLSARWELDDDLGEFIIRPYKPVYFLPIYHSSDVNRLPQTPNPNTTLTEELNLDHLEAKIQLSFKTKLGNDLLGSDIDLWLGYTQSSYWQIYNSDESRPFRETNHEPEFVFVLPTDYSFLGYRGRLLSLSLNHQSNGQDEPSSRSWNRAILNIGFEQPDWVFIIRRWWRLPETSDKEDENPQIEDYVGRAELFIVHRRENSHQISLQLRHSLRDGEDNRGSMSLNWSYPCFDRLRCHAQLFSGYGESLIDYNHRKTSIGLGVALLEWF